MFAMLRKPRPVARLMALIRRQAFREQRVRDAPRINRFGKTRGGRAGQLSRPHTSSKPGSPPAQMLILLSTVLCSLRLPGTSSKRRLWNTSWHFRASVRMMEDPQASPASIDIADHPNRAEDASEMARLQTLTGIVFVGSMPCSTTAADTPSLLPLLQRLLGAPSERSHRLLARMYEEHGLSASRCSAAVFPP